MSSDKLKKLIEHRDTILLAEIGALIHDLGKLSEEFVSNKSIENPLDIEKDRHAQWIFEWYSQLADILKNLKITIKEITISTKKGKKSTSAELSLKELIEHHHNEREKIKDFDEKQMNDSNYARKYLMTVFSQCADGIDSGIDKGAVTNTNKQSVNYTFISTSFGYEFEKIDINSKQLKQYRDEFIQKLKIILDQIQKLLSKYNAIPAEEWINPKDKLLESARECFIHALGETRRSANDVTLWDHSYSTASLYKSALAGIIISGQWKDPSKLKWRLLSIRFNGFDYIMKSNKVGDILGRKKRLELVLDLVKYLLEVYVPIGNEIYRDENGSVFLVPESFDNNALNEWSIGENILLLIKDEKIVKDRKKIIEFLVDGSKPDIVISIEPTDTIKSAVEVIFNEITYGELKPDIKVSEASRGAVNLGKVLEENKILFNQPFTGRIQNAWKGKRSQICRVCWLKPSEDNLNICEDCFKIKQSRAKTWYKERIKYKSTIWIDEVCDKNRRVGVVVGAFDLSNWLNGMWLNTVFTKTLEDLQNDEHEVKVDGNRIKVKNVFYQIKTWDDLIKAVAEAIEKNDPNTELNIKKEDGTSVKVKELLKALGSDSYHKQKAKDYFEAIVEEREADVIKWAYETDNMDALPNEEKAKLLILALFRKNPSFARIRRIWETTKRFWDNIEELIKKELDTRTRYKILIYKKLEKLREYIAYELRVDGLRMPIFCSKIEDNRTELIIIENLEDLGTNLEQLKSKLEGGKFEIWEDSDYAKSARKLYPSRDLNDIGRFKVEIERDSEYVPYISILKEPTLFIAMLPLNKYWDIIKLIKKEYEIQFSKVQNRLPIKLGLIAFKRKYPLYIVMDAVKRLISEEIEEKVFKVKRIERLSAEENCERFNGRLGNYASIVEVEGKNRNFKFYISYSLRDPNLEDFFYPYFIVIETKDVVLDMTAWLYNKYIKNLNKLGAKVKKDVLLHHVSKLKNGDVILFEPSIFDFEFLDSNIRRFDIGEKRKHWLFTDSTNKPKPYLLWDIDYFERLRKLIQKLGLTTTQIMNLYEMLMAKLEEWEIRKLPAEFLSSGNKEDEEKAKVFEKLVENAIKSIPLRLEVVDGESSKGKISKEDFKFLKDSIISGLFFDFVDLWHTILKKKFEEGEENV